MKEKINKYYFYYKNEIKKCIKDYKSIKTVYKQIPNILTSSRAFAPLIIIPLGLSGNVIATLWAIGLFASTDFFDGLIARLTKTTSKIGKDLDAVCDKIFSIGLSIPLMINNPVYLITIILEVIIGSCNLKSKLDNNEPKTIYIGKVKTAFLSLNILLGYLGMGNFINLQISSTIFILTSTIQALTAKKYIEINNKKEKEKKLTNIKNCNNEFQNSEKLINNDFENVKSYDNKHKDEIESLKKLKKQITHVDEYSECKTKKLYK